MKRVLFFAMATVLLGAALAPPVMAGPAKPAKVAICHYEHRTDSFKLVKVASKAVTKHLKHGDLFPGDRVPGQVGFVLDWDCSLLHVEDGDGVPDPQDNCPNTYNPDQFDRYGKRTGDACEDIDADGTFDVDEEHMCVHVDGVYILQSGTADCLSDPTTGANPNIAIANGDRAYAYGVDGDNSVGTAIGDNAYAEAAGTSGNNTTATATGVSAYAVAFGGSGASAIAIGDGAVARATHAIMVGNRAYADGVGAFAWASIGDNNAASATGAGTHAEAGGISTQNGFVYYDNNTAIVSLGGIFASAHYITGCVAVADTIYLQISCQ